MAGVSSDVLWELLKDNNSFLIRKNGNDFSTDPYNMLNAHKQKFAGIASNSGVGVGSRKKGDPVVLRLKKLRKNQPKKNHHEDTVAIKRGGFAGPARNALKGIVESRNTTLVKVALERMKKLHSTEVPKKVISRKH
ncbi:hypothetical protein SteCoe_30076 [Stentor coeruleus]|uniref:Ribosomal eL28/Mak16 domain-containing protein n=1 Tax=Stentor coeruleus TaxID=5963 RepID=A0A1R2B4I6_9CILI|nr:hypothetical protein SteCoe_30076 [Stentor coeruleus]